MEDKTFPLTRPITVGSEEITELTFTDRPKAKHFRGITIGRGGAIAMGEMLDLAGRLCSQPPSVMDELSPVDMMRVMEVVTRFLPDSLTTSTMQ